MADTIRDVIIKIRTQQVGPTKLMAPDVSAFEAAIQSTIQRAQQGVNSLKPALSAASTAAPATSPTATATTPTTTAATSTLSTYQNLSKQTADQAEADAKRAQAAWQSALSAASKPPSAAKSALNESLDDSFGLPKETKSAGDGGAKQATAAAREQAQAEQAVLAAARQKLEVYSAMGEGALRAARGVAFLTAANEDDMKVALQYVAAAQGVLDVFAGSASIFKSVITLRTAQATTTAAAATGETALATATGGAIAMTNAQTAATVALNVALAANPVTMAILAAAAATVGVGYLALKNSTDEANAALDEQHGQLTKVGTDFDRLAEQAERGRVALSKAASEYDQAMSTIERSNSLGLVTEDEMLEKMRARAALQKGILETEHTRGNLGVGVTGAANWQAQTKEIDAGVLDKELDVRRKQTVELEKQRDLAQQALNTAKMTVEEAKKGLLTEQEKFGRMNKGDQDRLKNLSQQRQSGKELSEQDAKFLDRVGFGGKATSEFYQKKGDAAGFDQVSKGFGLDKALQQAKDQLKASEATAGTFVEDATAQIMESRASMENDMKKVVELYAEAASFKQMVEAMQNEQQRMKNNQQDKDVNK